MATDFEQWVAENYPRATVHVAGDSLQRLTLGLYDRPIIPAAATVIIANAWQRSTWLVSFVNWRIRTDGTLGVHEIEFVRGMP